MPVNLSQIASATTTASALSNLILVTPNLKTSYQPQNGSDLLGQAERQRPPKLLFHYEGEQTIRLESDITDHFVEDNTARQDQIALKPPLLTTKGFIGELNDVVPEALEPLKLIADKLSTVVAFTPELTIAAQIAYAQAFLAYQVAATAIDAGVSAWSSIQRAAGFGQSGETVLNESTLIDLSTVQSKQAVYFQQFWGYWNNRVLFTVQTPWGVFSDCAIKDITARQNADTNVISEFDVTFKLMRFASTDNIAFAGQGRAVSQASPLVDLGVSKPAGSVGLSDALSSNYGVA